jgi:galactose mutarotase-like enzyme
VPLRQISVSGHPALALTNDEIEVVCVPTLGGKLTNLRRRNGREWLWRNPAIPLAVPVPGASYVETADSGGWDECFPTIGPCPMPGSAPDAPPLPDHGELWALPWEHTVQEDADGTTLTGYVEGTFLPFDLARELFVPRSGAWLRLRYRLRHRGTAAFPFIWAAHPLLNVAEGTTVALPTGGGMRVISAAGPAPVREGEERRWPVTGAGAAWTFPGNAGWAMMLDVEIGASKRIEVTDPVRGERLLFEPGDGVERVGLWVNAAGWAPPRVNGRPGPAPYVNLGVEPCLGAADRLDRAVERWRDAPVLAPGESRRWSLTVRLPDPRDD